MLLRSHTAWERTFHRQTWRMASVLQSERRIICNNVQEIKVHVCINSAGLICTIWARGLMHLLRLLAAMSSVDAGWTRPIIS